MNSMATWSDWFDDMVLLSTDDDQTLLVGPIADQPALHGIFKKCRNLGLSILLVEQNVEQALKHSQRAYILESGRITRSDLSHNLAKDEDIRRAYLGL